MLLKPGPLTPGEWTLMQAQVQTGEALARRIPGLADGVLAVIRSHHERWDGGGYPLGQAGHSIPLTGRIVAVADVFDALTNERPYKSAWTRAQALAELQRQADQQFDPEVVAAGLRVFSRVEGPITPR